MANFFQVLKLFLRLVMKLAGMTPQKVEIEPGTMLNFWVPTQIVDKTKKPKQTMNRRSVVFLHGFFSDGILTWLFQVLALASTYDVYVPDLLFFGESTTDKPDRSVSFQAECLAKGLRKLGVERCTVVGFSYGGSIAFKLAMVHSELVESLIITGATMELNQSTSMPVGMLLPETIEGLKLLISTGSHGKFFTSFPRFVYRDFLEVMYSNGKERAELLKAFVDAEFTPSKHSQKLCLLWGENDQIVTLDAARNMKGATLDYISDAGHLVMLERPGIFNRHLRRILASLDD